MQSVNMNREDLLAIVRANRDKHATEFEETLLDYKNAALKIAKENLKIVKSGDLSKFSKARTIPPVPTSYLKEYDRAIRMLALSVDPVIEVDQTIFNQLVLDEWAWKNAFVTASALYKSI